MAEDTTSRVGQQIGNYRLIKLLGQGSFADVYLGEHTLLKTQVAVKIMRVHLTQSLMEDFLNEAQTVARLRHPHIVRVFEGNVENGTPYLVMDYHPGGTMRGLYPPGTQLPPTQVALFIEQVGAALYYAHQQKLIHRDVKPENILVDAEGQLLLSDFGLVLIAQSSRSQTVNVIAGTAPYMAPEQLQGRLRFASDQYSLGIIAYEWLTGERPFKGSFVEIASQHMLVPPPSLQQKVPTLPDAVEQVVLKALAKEPTQRFANTVEFAHALTQACMDLSYLPTALLTPPDHASPQQPAQQAQSVGATPPMSQANPVGPSTPSGHTVQNGATQLSQPPTQQAQSTSTTPSTAETYLITPPVGSDKTVLSNPPPLSDSNTSGRPSDPVPVVAPQLSSSFSKDRKKTSLLFVLLAILAIVVVVIGSLTWFLTRPAPQTAAVSSPTSVVVVAKGQVYFQDSQNNAPGATDALKITATGLSNPPDGSAYNAWLVDTTNEQVLPLGSFSKSDPTTFALSFASAGSQSQVNLIGAGNKIEVTQEQGSVTAPAGKVVLSAVFPPQAFVHIRHLLFKFPTTPGNIGLLPGLINETQKVNTLAQLLQQNTGSNFAVTCIAQAIVNVSEGKNGAHFSPLAARCANVGINNAVTGDGFGILSNGSNGYTNVASAHAVLAASQSDSTDTIRQYAKDVETSTDSVKGVITKIDDEAIGLLTNPAAAAGQVSELVTLSDRAYRGFDQNGDGRIDPIVGEAGALTAYTSGQRIATLTLA